MINLPVGELANQMIVARPVLNPTDPGNVILPQGTVLTGRLPELLRRIHFRTIWVTTQGTDAVNAEFPEELSLLYQEIFGELAKTFDDSREGDLAQDRVIVYRKHILALLANLRRTSGTFVPVLDIDLQAEECALFGVIMCHLSLLVLLEMHNAIFGSNATHEEHTADYVQLGISALFHEIGKTKVPIQVLHKEAWDLTQHETSLIESYAVKGCRLLQPIAGAIVACAVLRHHLYEDGSGFPQELEESKNASTGEFGRTFGRILAIAHAYCALVYRQGYAAIEALEELNCARRGQFDPDTLRAFNNVVLPFPIGSPLALGSGHRGVVLHTPDGQPFRPTFLVLWDKEGDAVAEAQRIPFALAEYPKATVSRVSGQDIRHLLPADPASRWEDMQ